MTYEAKLANIILRLKEVKKNQPEFTLQKISDHTGVSFTTVSRVFAEGSETQSFRYDSVRPIAQMLLGIDDLDEGGEDEKALKAIIQFKDARIKELEQKLAEEREKHEKKLAEEREKHEKKIEKERVQNRTSIDFLKNQIELKDDRINRLLTALERRSALYEELQTKYLKLTEKES